MSRLRRAVGVLLEGSMYVLLFLLPFSKAAIEVTFVLLLIGWIAERLIPGPCPRNLWVSARLRLLLFVLLAYLGICALSISVSSHPALSVRGFVGKWLEYLLLFLIIADMASRPHIVERSLKVFTWSSCLVVVEAVTQEVWGRGLLKRYPLYMYGRMSGPYENPIDLATYLMVIIPVLLFYSIRCQRSTRHALQWLVLLLVVCLGRTGALGAWVGLCVGLLAIVGRNATIRRYGLLMLVGLLLACGFFLQRQGRLAMVFSGDDTGKIDRWVMWQAAIGMIRDRPVLGHGLNTFMANYLDYWVGGERQPRYAHNCYLQVAAETGLLGLASFLGLLGVLFARLASGLRRVGPDDHVVLFGCLVGLLGFATQASIDTNFYSLRQAALFWTLAGLAVGISEQAERGSTPATR